MIILKKHLVTKDIQSDLSDAMTIIHHKNKTNK